jgi:hypothetical protein
MAIIDQKSDIFGNIAASRVLGEGLPKLKTNSSFPSINNDGDTVAFLVDLLKSLVGLEGLREVIVDTLAYNLDGMEEKIKTAMKQSLKELVNCGVDPSIPDYIKSNGVGIVTEVNKIDFFDILKTDPTTTEGAFIYTDTTANPLTNSTDYNTFLYGAIQNDGVSETWGNSPSIFDIRFDSTNIDPAPNNTLTFNANSDFDNKKLTEFNNTFIDSIDLFDAKNLLNSILDAIFGSVSVQLNKSTEQLVKEEQIKTIIKCIIDADDDDVIDNSFFTFTNDEVAAQEESATLRQKGIKIIESCERVPVRVNANTIISINNTISGATTSQEQKVAIDNAISEVSSEVGGQAPDSKDSHTLELNFIENLIENLITSIVGFILSPKIISIFLINYKIIYGVTETYDDASDFMKQNKNLVKGISDTVRNEIIEVLLTKVLVDIAILVGTTRAEIEKEKGKAKISQILSLVGVPQAVIRIIQGI